MLEASTYQNSFMFYRGLERYKSKRRDLLMGFI